MVQGNEYKWRNKRVLITGGAGFIGKHLTAKLCTLGADVSLILHRTKYPNPSFINEIWGDLTQDGENWETMIRKFDPEVIFHLAAQPIVGIAGENEWGTLKTNIDGTYNLLSVCKDLTNVEKFVHISTDKVYGNVDVIDKNTVPNGIHHPYNASKLASDFLAQMYSNFFDIPTVVIRNANVYGAGDIHFDRIIPRTIFNVLYNKPPVIRGSGMNRRDYIHVYDVIDGYIAAAELPATKEPTILNLSGHNHSVIEVIDTVLKSMNRIDLSLKFEQQWKGEIPNQHIVNDIARELIGWIPSINLESGIRITVPWYVSYVEKHKDD